jgi:purine-cytosine permease-like protein
MSAFVALSAIVGSGMCALFTLPAAVSVAALFLRSLTQVVRKHEWHNGKWNNVKKFT